MKFQYFNYAFELDDFQKEAIEHIDNTKSVVVSVPTGAGKTLIAEYAVDLALRLGKRVFYTTPLKALSNQKYNDFKRVLGEEKVGLLTGDIAINREASVVVMTTEVYRNMLYSTNFGLMTENLRDVSTVVLDECHYMNDEQRGTVWEECIIYTPSNIQLIALSATIANAESLKNWMSQVQNTTELVVSDQRPVPLRYMYFNDKELMPLLSPGGKLNTKLTHEHRHTKKGKKGHENTSLLSFLDILGAKNMLPAIYFTFSRRRCNKYLEDASKINLLTDMERKKLEKVIRETVGNNAYLLNNDHLKYLYQGIAAHHAGLLPLWKSLVEQLFQQGLIKVVFATETLAAGINMPAKTTIISSISKRGDHGHRMLTANEFFQMAGRAGRRGIDDIGYVITISNPYQSPQETMELIQSGIEPLQSQFSPNYHMVLNLLQQYSMEEARHLILKSFGYFTSTERLHPLYEERNYYQARVHEAESFYCGDQVSTDTFKQYIKLKEKYISFSRINKVLKKQAVKGVSSQEVETFQQDLRDVEKNMEMYTCHRCKVYKKHKKILDSQERFVAKLQKIEKNLHYQEDLYWRNFINISNVLETAGYLVNEQPSEIGKTASSFRTENELFLCEIIDDDLLQGLKPSELAAVLCAILTEGVRNDGRSGSAYFLQKRLKETMNRIYKKYRHIHKLQQENQVHILLLFDPTFSPIIQAWAEGEEWSDLITNIRNIDEGDIVRAIKRTIDLLKQIVWARGIPDSLSDTARKAVNAMERDPIKEIV